MLILRNSHLKDKSRFVELFLLSSPYFNELLGKNVKNILGHLFGKKRNLFSYENVFIAEFNGEVCGMILCYPSSVKEKDNLRTGMLLFANYFPIFIFRIKRFLFLNKAVGKIEKDDFYISNIAIFSKFRGIGIGKRLMDFCEKLAIKCRSKRLVLDVEKENINAISFYKSIGFEIIKEDSVIFRRDLRLNFLRMAKLLIGNE